MKGCVQPLEETLFPFPAPPFLQGCPEMTTRGLSGSNHRERCPDVRQFSGFGTGTACVPPAQVADRTGMEDAHRRSSRIVAECEVDGGTDGQPYTGEEIDMLIRAAGMEKTEACRGARAAPGSGGSGAG